MGERRAALVRRLRGAGCVFAEDEADLLLAAAHGPELDALVERRVAGEPLEHVLGWALFAGRRIAVDPGVFVPRRRSEFLAEHAVRGCGAASVVVELCCGAGAIATTIAHAVPGAEVHAADLDPAAVRCARRNLGALGTAHQGDLYAALPARLRGRIDVLAVNAPYVPSDEVAFMPAEARLHEPLMALDGGADGLDVHRRIMSAAGAWLRRGGRLIVETSEAQAPADVQLMEHVGMTAAVVRSAGLDATVVIGSTDHEPTGGPGGRASR